MSNIKTSDIRLHYWRDESLEVDFVLKRSFQLIPIEVKSGSKTMPLQHKDPFLSGPGHDRGRTGRRE